VHVPGGGQQLHHLAPRAPFALEQLYSESRRAGRPRPRPGGAREQRARADAARSPVGRQLVEEVLDQGGIAEVRARRSRTARGADCSRRLQNRRGGLRLRSRHRGECHRARGGLRTGRYPCRSARPVGGHLDRGGPEAGEFPWPNVPDQGARVRGPRVKRPAGTGVARRPASGRRPPRPVNGVPPGGELDSHQASEEESWRATGSARACYGGTVRTVPTGCPGPYRAARRGALGCAGGRRRASRSRST